MAGVGHLFKGGRRSAPDPHRAFRFALPLAPRLWGRGWTSASSESSSPRLEVSTEHADFFTRNMVAILAEQRLALAVKQAGALTYGDLGNVA